MAYSVLAGVLAILASMKYTVYVHKKCDDRFAVLEEKLELMEKRLVDTETETPKRMMATLLPVAKAVQKLNQEVGL